MQIEFLRETGQGQYLFQVVDYASHDPMMAMAVAMGRSNLSTSLMKELPFAVERRVMEKMWPRIEKVHKRGARCLAVMDVSDFPLLGCYVDERDQRRVHPEQEGRDEFSKDVVSRWLSYDRASEVPVIVVNVNIPHTGLKIFRKDAFGL
jgi:hypothetical protein